MPVADVLAVRRDSDAYNTRDHAGLFYAESWALTHMLLVDERYKAATPRLISLSQSGVSSVDALRQAYGKSPAEVEKDLRAYIGRSNYGFFNLDFHPAAPPAQPTRPAAVPPFEASLVVADMLASEIGKDLETRAMLESLAREQPDNVELLELRAFFELRTLGIGAADPYFRRAVDRGSRNATVLAEYALRIGDKEIQVPTASKLTEHKFDEASTKAIAGFKKELAEALKAAGYPAKADMTKANAPLAIAILFVLVIYVTMVYGPIAAMLVEMFPTRIRYTSMSLPYHIGNGWFGGLLPSITFAMVAQNGNIYHGLWYPIVIAAVTFVIGVLFVRETKDVDIYAKD